MSNEFTEEEEKNWWSKRRFDGISEKRKQKIKEAEKQVREAEKEAARIIEEGLKDPERNFETKETAEKVEKQKAEKIRKIYEG